MKTKISNRFIYERVPGKLFSADVVTSKSRTLQHYKGESDINLILKKYRKTGVLVDPLTKRSRVPMFGDFSVITDFQEQKNRMLEIDREFMKVNPEIRKRFDNSVEKLVDFIADEANKDECIKLGLRKADAPPKYDRVIVDGKETVVMKDENVVVNK